MKYECTECKAEGVKLWRTVASCAQAIDLYCRSCAKAREVDQIKEYASFSRDTDFGIGDLLPALPTEDNESFWFVACAPPEVIDRWQALEGAATISEEKELHRASLTKAIKEAEDRRDEAEYARASLTQALEGIRTDEESDVIRAIDYIVGHEAVNKWTGSMSWSVGKVWILYTFDRRTVGIHLDDPIKCICAESLSPEVVLERYGEIRGCYENVMIPLQVDIDNATFDAITVRCHL